MKITHRLTPVLVSLVLAACAENPAAVDEHADATGDLQVQLSVTPDHVHILQSEVTFTVTVTDHHGEAVTDFESLVVERKAHDSETWRAVEMTLQGDSYVGTYVFSSSGEYEIRVAGMRHGDPELVVMHTMAEHMEVARAHGELGVAYRAEFESFPGHVHEGETVTLRVWVMEAERNAEGIRPPITGLTGTEIHVQLEGGAEESHALTESEPGLYEADHDFLEAGHYHIAFHAEIDGQSYEAEFEVEAVPAH